MTAQVRRVKLSSELIRSRFPARTSRNYILWIGMGSVQCGMFCRSETNTAVKYELVLHVINKFNPQEERGKWPAEWEGTAAFGRQFVLPERLALRTDGMFNISSQIHVIPSSLAEASRTLG